MIKANSQRKLFHINSVGFQRHLYKHEYPMTPLPQFLLATLNMKPIMKLPIHSRF